MIVSLLPPAFNCKELSYQTGCMQYANLYYYLQHLIFQEMIYRFLYIYAVESWLNPATYLNPDAVGVNYLKIVIITLTFVIMVLLNKVLLYLKITIR